MAADQRFNEDSLRADIVKVWGEHGAHIDVFDHMLRRCRDAAANASTDRSNLALAGASVGDIVRFKVKPENVHADATFEVVDSALAISARRACASPTSASPCWSR